MRIAVLIIGLVLTFGLFIQSLLISALSDAANTEQDGAEGAVGVMMSVMWLVAVALVIPFPLVSVVLFGLAGFIGIVAASPLDYPDLAVWGVVGIVLAIFSLFGWRGKLKKQAKEDAKDAQLTQSIVAQQQMAAQLAQMQNQYAGYQHPGSWPVQPGRPK